MMAVMAKHIVVFNTASRPVQITASGRTVGGGEWAAVNAEDPAAARGLASGALLEVAEPDADVELDPGAQAAFAAAADQEISVPAGDSATDDDDSATDDDSAGEAPATTKSTARTRAAKES